MNTVHIDPIFCRECGRQRPANEPGWWAFFEVSGQLGVAPWDRQIGARVSVAPVCGFFCGSLMFERWMATRKLGRPPRHPLPSYQRPA